MVVGELEALLKLVMVPERLPVVVGAKITLKDVDWPAARDKGTVMPVAEKELPATLTWEMETAELPVFVNVTFCVAMLPVLTVPKLRVVGEAEMVRLGKTPVPERDTVSGDVGALLISERLARKLLAEEGLKPTVNVEEPPGSIVRGSDSPE
jgi:hypothetical protein